LARQLYTLLTQGWQHVFAQARTLRRALEHAFALPCVLGRRTLSRTVCALGRASQDWSADYKIFSRSRWPADQLFDPVLQEHLHRYPQGPIAVALDDTRLPKTGKKIPTATWHRDPMSPPFRVNLIFGLRFVQASLLFPHYREGDFAARAYPVRFQEAPSVKKPGRRAPPEALQHYRLLQKQKNLSTQTREVLRGLRARLDALGAPARALLAAVDGSFCNRTFFKTPWDRLHLVARCRKDARLCFPAPAGSRRRYALETFTPERVRQDAARPWQRARIHFAGTWRQIRYKQVRGVLWKRGAGRRPLRLIVLRPQPYKTSPHARTSYRQPAYLLSTDTTSSVALLIQTYCDRWQIELNHRDEKSLLGVGQAQVRASLSVPRHPAFAVACYSLLLLAALRAFGPGRPAPCLPLPQWRTETKRASLLDLLTLLRSEMNETPVSGFLNQHFGKNLVLHANA
jgi:hypothetical protein